MMHGQQNIKSFGILRCVFWCVVPYVSKNRDGDVTSFFLNVRVTIFLTAGK